MSARSGGSGRRPWVVAALCALGALGLASAPGCDAGQSFSARRTLTSTVTLGNERALLVDAPVELVVEGFRRRDTIGVELDATLTASTASTAARLAGELEVSIDRGTPGVIALVLATPGAAGLGGRLRVLAPADLDLGVIGRGGPVDVRGVEGQIEVVSATHARVEGATRDVRVRVERGNALVFGPIAPGTLTDVEVGAGSAQLTLPARPSVAIEAASGNGGAVVVSHPALPRALPGLPYRAVVNGGLGAARLVTRAGDVVIRGP